MGARAVTLDEAGTVLAFEAATGEAFLRDPQGTVRRVRLTTPGWRLDRVAALNDAGQIVGHATNSATGERGAVLLTPTP